jgi:hypothetical protein
MRTGSFGSGRAAFGRRVWLGFARRALELAAWRAGGAGRGARVAADNGRDAVVTLCTGFPLPA